MRASAWCRGLLNCRRNPARTHVVVIGAGLGGISAAAYLAKAGHTVTVYEKDSSVGGRARGLERDGFHFEICPSWYWVPAEHDRWFAEMGACREDYYDLLCIEPGAGERRAAFLGSLPAKTPAVYTLMNYIDTGLGTWYPEGGFKKVVESMHKVAESHGVRFVLNTEITGIRSSAGRTSRVSVRSNCDEDEVHADAVVAGAEHPYVKKRLAKARRRSLSMKSWGQKTLAPAVLNYYVGLNRKLPSLAHRTFFCDTDWDEHCAAAHSSTAAAHSSTRGPDVPLFYLDIPSITDPSRAPEGQEAMVISVPCVPGIEDSGELREHYFDIVLDRIERLTGETLRDAIVLRETAWLAAMNNSKKFPKLFYAGLSTICRGL